MTTALLALLQTASAAASPESVIEEGWLDPMFLFFIVFAVAQLAFFVWLLLSRSDEPDSRIQ